MLILLCISPNIVQSQCVLTCSNIQVSLDANCQSEITPAMVSGGSDTTCSAPLVVEIFDLDGNLIPTSPIITVGYIDQTLIGKLIDTLTGNFCTDTLLIEDKLAPIITCPIDTAIFMMELPDTMLTGAATSLDACGNSTVSYSDMIDLYPVGISDTIQFITRTWTATDDSGNQSTCAQIIYLRKPDVSMVTFPLHLDDVQSPALSCGNANTTIANCGQPHINGYIVSNITGFSSSHIDNIVDLCDGSYALYREWKVIDIVAAQDVEHNQVINVNDTIPPNLTCPADMVVTTNGNNCLATVIIPNPLMSDGCASTDSITIVLQVSSGQIAGNTIYDLDYGVHIATCVATDACGNQSTCDFTITVEDSQPPVAVTNSSPNVTLVPVGTTYVQASTFDDGSWDNCGAVDLAVRRMDLPTCDSIANDFAPTVPFYCCDIGSPVTIQLRVTDSNGNESFALSDASVFDNTSPGILCASDVTINCTADYTDLSLTGDPTAMDNCENFQLEYNDVEDINNCGEGTVTRTWTITDMQGLTNICTQVITLENPNVFYINPIDPDDPNDDIVWPSNFTSYTCNGVFNPDSLPTMYSYPQVTADTCEFIGISHTDTDITITPDACRKILRTWLIIDWCQFNPLTFEGKWEYGQIITILDSSEPIFIDNCQDLSFCINENNCDGRNVLLEVEAKDDCTPETDLTYSYQVDFNNDGIIDTTNTGKSIDFGFPFGNHTVTFEVQDGCDQTTTCTYNVEVVDCFPPVPVCFLSLGVELNGDQVTINAASLNEGSSDNCFNTSELVYSYSTDITNTDSTFTCDDLGFNPVQMWVTDPAGNQSVCTAFIEIQDNPNLCVQASTASVIGNIKDEDGQNIEQVELEINDNSIPPITTGPNGNFIFNFLQVGQDYEVEPQKNINFLNGVTTFDLVLIRKHILGLELLNSPYKIIAGDVNHSGTLTSLDIVEIRKLILHIDDEFADGKSWRFIDKNHTFSNPINPFLDPFPEVIEIYNISNNVDVEFVAIKKGDVNNTAQPDFLIGTDTRTRANNLTLHIDNQQVTSKQKTIIDFHANNFESIDGFQFSLKFKTDEFDFEKIQAGALVNFNENNYSLRQLDDGIITFSWNGNSPLSFDKDAVLFSIEMEAKTETDLSNIFYINSNPTIAEAYSKNEIWDVQLDVLEKSKTTFSLLQNSPNPFSESTLIQFYLPELSETTLSIFNLDGKLIFENNNTFTKGMNEILIDKNDLKTQGVFYYQLKTKFGSATRKMVILR